VAESAGAAIAVPEGVAGKLKQSVLGVYLSGSNTRRDSRGVEAAADGRSVE